MGWPRILVVDDDPGSAEYMSLALEQAHYETRKAADAVDALRVIERELPSLVISDLRMPGMNGLELLQCIRDRWPTLPVILATVEGDIATVVLAVQRGAVNYLVKPVSPPILLPAAANAMERLARLPEPEKDPSACDIVGFSAAVLRVRHQVALAARSDVNVMVVGETGTGKELVARAIHRLSGKPSSPFVAHNCATTPPEMFDAEFFGHKRGSFTGAHRDRPGLLRDADGGTLLLDELECLSLPNQAKLLRVLDDGEVRAVGSDKAISVSVRFIAATNKPPEIMLATGDLRLDLYYRLRGFEIRLPPLRERLEDVEPLSAHFLHGSGRHLASGGLDALRRCSWPGNVRQLRTVLRRAATRGVGQAIDIGDLDLQIPGGIGGESAAPAAGWRLQDSPPADYSLEAVEREAITRALDANGGNRARAARALGIHRSTLVRRLRELGLVGQGTTGRGRGRGE